MCLTAATLLLDKAAVAVALQATSPAPAPVLKDPENGDGCTNRLSRRSTTGRFALQGEVRPDLGMFDTAAEASVAVAKAKVRPT